MNTPRVADPDSVWLRHIQRTDATAPWRMNLANLDELAVCAVGHAAVAGDNTLTTGALRGLFCDDGLTTPSAAGTYVVAPKSMGDGTHEVRARITAPIAVGVIRIFGACIRWLDAQNSLWAYVSINSTDVRVYVLRWSSTGTGVVGIAAPAAYPAGTDHFTLKVNVHGNNVDCTVVDGESGATLLTNNIVLTGSYATTFGAGISGRVGLVLKPGDAAAQLRITGYTAISATDDPDAYDILPGVAFKAAPLDRPDSINAEDGWMSGEVICPLSDDGEFTLALANNETNRKRLALLTDPDYRPGEEWLEVYRQPGDVPDDVLTVATPHSWDFASAAELRITAYDLAGFLNRTRAGNLDAWWHAPRDVFDHYSRIEHGAVVSDFRAFSLTPEAFEIVGDEGPPLPPGWTNFDGGGNSIPGQGWGMHALGDQVSRLEADVTGTPVDEWEWTATLTVTQIEGTSLPEVGVYVLMPGGRYLGPADADEPAMVKLKLGTADGTVTFEGTGASYGAAGKVPLTDGQRRYTFSLVARGEWLMAFVNGRLIGDPQRRWLPSRTTGAFPTPPIAAGVQISANGTGAFEDPNVIAIVLHEARMVGRYPFGLRGADRGDDRLPGLPTPGGLRGRYYDATAIAYRNPDTSVDPGLVNDWRHLALPYTGDPKATRLDPAIKTPLVQPTSLPADRIAARWTGSILLNFDNPEATPTLRLTGLDNTDDWARLWVGRTRWTDALQDTLSDSIGAGSFGVDLRKHLGPDPQTGWYPIIVEWVGGTDPEGITLQRATINGAGVIGAWSTVDSGRLSPYGAFEGEIRRDPARDVIGTISEGFGYQWRTSPRTLESGEFPGQIIPRVREGRDTDAIVDADNTDVGARGDTRDTVDRLLLDAAGLAENQGVTQLTAEFVNAKAGANHLALITDFESLADVSEEAMIAQRGGSLLALRASANEEVGVRPDGKRDLVDSFPLTGELARMDWSPGDGVRLALPDVSVTDITPRQMARVTWPVHRAGVGIPNVGFRQRPRNPRNLLRRIFRGQALAQRNYQGQLATYSSDLGTQAAAAYVVLPANVEDVVRLDLVVTGKTDASEALPSLNDGPLLDWGVTDVTAGLDITDLLAPFLPTKSVFKLAFPAGGGQTLTGEIYFFLRITIRI